MQASFDGLHVRLCAGCATLLLCVLCACAPSALAFPAGFATEGSAAGQVTEPRGVAVNQESADVFVSDRNNNRIDRFAAEGAFELT